MARGFSLIEVLIATAVLAAAALGLAQLLVMSVRVNYTSRLTTMTSVLALQKMEQLQSMSSGELTVSPRGAIDADTTGWFEFVDESGRVLDSSVGASFVRRWSIDAMSAAGAVAETVIVQVVVIPLPAAQSPSRQPGESRIVTIRRLLPA